MSDYKFKQLVKLIRDTHNDCLPKRSLETKWDVACIVTESLLDFAKGLEERHPDE